MSNRFYLNGFQVFSNNCLGRRTYEELNRQGIKWIEDGWHCWKQKIKDPHTLMKAINEDILSELKENVTKSYDDDMNIINKNFEDVTDADLYTSGNCIKNLLYTKDGKIVNDSWLYMREFISCKMAFTPMFAYLAIKDCCKWERNEKGELKLVLKPRRCVYVSMY